MGMSLLREEKYRPYLVMVLTEFSLATFIILLESLLSKGISPLVAIVYEHIVATFVLSTLALLLEKDRPPLSFIIVCYGFSLGLLEITLSQFVLALSLKFVGATNQTIALNMVTPVLFVLAVALRKENFKFKSIDGQAKLWGVVLSAIGGTVLVFTMGDTPPPGGDHSGGGGGMGAFLLVVAVLGTSSWNIVVDNASEKYPAILTLSAMMTFFGAIQTAILTFLMVERESWHLKGWLSIFVILYGGIVVTGFAYYAQAWCIHKKGPVFAAAFSPLLIVFSFFLETLIVKYEVHMGSIGGAALVVAGLYLLLWGKAKESVEENYVPAGYV